MKWEALQSLKVASMKSCDKARIKVLNDVIALVQKEQTKGKVKTEVTEQMITDCLIKEQKLLEEMVATCPDEGKYAERLADYMMQLSIIKEYAPQMITDEAVIRTMILDANNGEIELIKKNKGQIMKTIMPVLKAANCDMRVAQEVINTLLQ